MAKDQLPDSPLTLRNCLQLCIFIPTILTLSNCGGSASKKSSAETDAEIPPASTVQIETAEETSKLEVDAGRSQVSSSNALIRLSGEVQIKPEAEPASILWQQISGPAVDLINADQLDSHAIIPNFTQETDLTFQLTVWDAEGTAHSALTSILVRPKEVFAQVVGSFVAESAGVASFHIALAKAPSEPVAISYTTVDGTASAGKDYVETSGEIIFSPGETTKTVTVTLINDGEKEPAEQFTLQINTLLDGNTFENSAAAIIAKNESSALAQKIEFLINDAVTLVVGAMIDSELDTSAAPGSGEIVYSSANPSVATVDANGLIEAVSAGSSIITALKAADENFLAATTSVTVTVEELYRDKEPLSSVIEFALPIPLTMTVGDQLSNPAEVTQGAINSIPQYASSQPEVAVVDDSGLLTALMPGVTQISAFVPEDDTHLGAEVSFILTVEAIAQPLAQKLQFTPGANLSEITIEPNTGDTIDLAVELPLFEDGEILFDGTAAPGTGEVSITNSNNAVVEFGISADASALQLFPRAAGSSVISVTKAADERYAETTYRIAVRVADTREAPSLTFPDDVSTSMVIGEIVSNPVNYTDETISTRIRYMSSDETIAYVDEYGDVTGISVGEVSIRAIVDEDDTFLRAEAAYLLEVTDLYVIDPGLIDLIVPPELPPTLPNTSILLPAPEPTPTPPPTPAPPPEPTPEPTPEPSPEPSPEPTPEPSPEPSPEPTPEPTPEPSPEPEPKPSPEPAPESSP